MADETCGFIRGVVAELYNNETAEAIRIQYGGSMKPSNAKELMAMEEIDGGLIGGAALKAAISQGVKRGLFSNEAGMGSTPHAHAQANVKDPHDQGVVAMIGVFIDTFVVLTMTALVVLTSGVFDAKTGEMLPHITVTVVGTTIGTSTDTTGHYILNDVPEDTEFTIEVSALGYNTVTRTLKVNNGEPVEIDFALTEQQVSLDAVVVSANRNVTTRREASSLVSVLDQRLFDVTTSPTVAEGLNFQSGVRVERVKSSRVLPLRHTNYVRCSSQQAEELRAAMDNYCATHDNVELTAMWNKRKEQKARPARAGDCSLMESV
mgnify:CR=1 FL=1